MAKRPEHSKANDLAIQMAKKAEEDNKKAEAAKEIASKKAEAEKAKKAEKEKKEADAKEEETRKASLDAKNAEKTEADKAASKSAKDKKGKDKAFRKNHPTKLRVKLPPIDSYEKELEYIPDVPGRVVVRLERLMGSDRVRITDTKYLKTLLRQLEAEEQVIWAKRARQRKLAERNRFRQLAIEGYMEPGPDMQDLYQHPVFRVNRILNRLSKLDTKINHSPAKKLPPITPVEPFEEYAKTGKLFDFHPGHYLRMQTLYKEDEKAGQRPESVQGTDEQADIEFYKRLEAAKRAAGEETSPEQSGTDLRRVDEWGGEDFYEDEFEETSQFDDIAEEEEEQEQDNCALEILGRGSLTDAKTQYGITSDIDLLAEWQPFRSQLINQVYDDEIEGGAQDMYEFAKAVLGTYHRETMKADHFVTKGLRNF